MNLAFIEGIGIPSASIYYKELITEYGVDKIIRTGTCGALFEDIELRDVIIAMGACTDSRVNRVRFNDHDFAAIADFGLLERAVSIARKREIAIRVGNVFSADLFYTPEEFMFDLMEKHGILGVEMEAAGLYGLCAEYGARGLSICTVTDHIRRGEHLSPLERQTTLNDMIEMGLELTLEL